jgi:hypothetical protein
VEGVVCELRHCCRRAGDGDVDGGRGRVRGRVPGMSRTWSQEHPQQLARTWEEEAKGSELSALARRLRQRSNYQKVITLIAPACFGYIAVPPLRPRLLPNTFFRPICNPTKKSLYITTHTNYVRPPLRIDSNAGFAGNTGDIAGADRGGAFARNCPASPPRPPLG